MNVNESNMSDKNLILVKCIEKFPCLYNFNSNRYLKRDVCDKAWAEVAKETKLTVAECKDKWRNLRYGLLRSLRLNPDGTYKTKYYLHDEMEFIIPFMKTSKSHDTGHDMSHQVECDLDVNISTLHDHDNDQEETIEFEFSEPPTKISKRYEHLNRLLEKGGNSNESLDASRKMFLLSLVPEVNILTESQMRTFRRKVLALLDEIVGNPNPYDTWHELSHRQERQPSSLDDVVKVETSSL